jgi:hypothetical protein
MTKSSHGFSLPKEIFWGQAPILLTRSNCDLSQIISRNSRQHAMLESEQKHLILRKSDCCQQTHGNSRPKPDGTLLHPSFASDGGDNQRNHEN